MSEDRRFVQPSKEARARARALAERSLSADEFNAYVNSPMSDAEREHIFELIDWFCRRYPTPAERLEWARRAWKRWQGSASD